MVDADIKSFSLVVLEPKITANKTLFNFDERKSKEFFIGNEEC